MPYQFLFYSAKLRKLSRSDKVFECKYAINHGMSLCMVWKSNSCGFLIHPRIYTLCVSLPVDLMPEAGLAAKARSSREAVDLGRRVSCM